MLVKASHEAFLFVKWAGAAYLIFLGVRMMLSKSSALEASAPAPDIRGAHVFGRGILLQLANPKALIFFTAFLPQFVTPGAPIARQMLILGVTSSSSPATAGLPRASPAASRAISIARRERCLSPAAPDWRSRRNGRATSQASAPASCLQDTLASTNTSTCWGNATTRWGNRTTRWGNRTTRWGNTTPC
jgi:hypothetical protein